MLPSYTYNMCVSFLFITFSSDFRNKRHGKLQEQFFLDFVIVLAARILIFNFDATLQVFSSHVTIIFVSLTESPGLSFGFQQRQNVTFAHGTFDISNQLSVLLIQEFYFDLRALSLRARPAQDLHYSRPHYRFLHTLVMWAFILSARRITLARVAIFAIRATLNVQIAWTNLDHMRTTCRSNIILATFQRKRDIVSQKVLERIPY